MQYLPYEEYGKELYSRIFESLEGDPKDICKDFAINLYNTEGILLTPYDIQEIYKEIAKIYGLKEIETHPEDFDKYASEYPEEAGDGWETEFGYNPTTGSWREWFDFEVESTEVPDEVYDAIVTILYDMAKEDRYGRPYTDDGVEFLWVHNSEDGWLDQLSALLDFDYSEFAFDCMWFTDGKGIHTRDFDTFLKGFLDISKKYRNLNPEALAILRRYLG